MRKVEIVMVTLLLVLAQLADCPILRSVRTQNGPRSDLGITWYTDANSAFAALQNNEIDLMQWTLTKTQRDAAEADPNLQVVAADESGTFDFDINNNHTIADYRNVQSPVYEPKVRAAIACLVDKDYFISDFLAPFASRVDVPISPIHESWWNPSVIGPNYPWNHNVTKAVELLAAAGFSDTDSDGYLNYPVSWPGIGNLADNKTQTMKLKICIRSDMAVRLQAGRLLVAALEGDPAVAGDSELARSPRWGELGKVGGDFDTTDSQFEAPRSVLSPIVMGAKNYHIYTGGWSTGSSPPPISMYYLFHTAVWSPYSLSHLSISYPDLDWQLEMALNALYAGNLTDSMFYCKNAQSLLVSKYCACIWLWTYKDYYAYRKELAGVVNMKYIGPVNQWTFLNAYRASNPSFPVRVGTVSGWSQLNILYSDWLSEFTLLDRVYDGLINVNPYDLASYVPWVAQDWEVGSWVDPRDGNTKTTATYYLRKNVGCAAPVIGTFGGLFTAEDYEFTCWYNYAFDDDWQWSSFMDINHIEKLNNFTVKVYFDALNERLVYSPTYPLLGPRSALSNLLCTASSATFAGSSLVANGGQKECTFTIDRVVQLVSATRNGAPIIEGVDFYIRGGYDTYQHNVFVAVSAFAPTDTIVVNYLYATPNGADGTYLGGNLGCDWTDTMFAYGAYFPLSISGTSASLNRNQYFFLETPPLGEIDWRWYYNGTTKPRSGYYKIDILDVVKATSTYGSRGDGLYNPAYLPGADLDASDLCHTGILDLVTITSKYAQTFGQPP